MRFARLDLFGYLDWQRRHRRAAGADGQRWLAAGDDEPAGVDGAVVVRVLGDGRGAGREPGADAPAGRRGCARRAEGCSVTLLGCRRRSDGGRLVSQPRRLPESLDPDDVAVFLADLDTHRDRAIVAGDGAGRSAIGRGAGLAAGRCRHGHAPRAGGRQGRPGTARADRRGVLRRVRRLSPHRTPGRVPRPWSASWCCGARPGAGR